MSLSTCESCGGHIPLGPNASNRCESCGLGVFDAHADPSPKGHLGDYLLQVREERDALRVRVAELEEAFDNLFVHATHDIIHGWVSIPKVEWDAATETLKPQV